MGVELIYDKDPFGFRVGCYRLLDMHGKVFLGPCRTDRRGHYLSLCHFKVSNQRLRTVTNVLELAQLDLAGDHRACRMLAFQCLDAGFLVGADQTSALLIQLPRGRVQITEGLDLLVEPFGILWTIMVQPVSTQMRFQVCFLLKSAPHFGRKCCRQSAA